MSQRAMGERSERSERERMMSEANKLARETRKNKHLQLLNFYL
jgi:hypothetical protein